MSKVKIENSIFSILFEGARIYGANFVSFTKYMLFPVLGQVLGLGLIFWLAAIYADRLPELMEKYPAFNDFSTQIVCVMLIMIPGMLIVMKALWDFLVAYGALNSMAESAVNTGKVYDFPAHNAVITNRTFKFIALWFVIGVMMLLASFPLLWLFGGIFFIYFVLVFQVFTFEEDASIYDCFKRSLMLIKGNFARTFVIMAVIAFFTHYLFVQGFSVFFDLTKITEGLGSLFEGWITNNIPIDGFNNYMVNINPRFEVITSSKIAGMFVYNIVFFIVTGLTLPLRSICWTLWYKALSSANTKSSPKPRTVKSKQLDSRILKRAKQKEED